ncbi:MAG: LCP family protein [Clostridia bacterium]|nr:LCP family protein [Clostridia bacterium]
MADYENNEGASPKKRLIIGLVVLVVVAALAIGAALILRKMTGDTDAPVTEPPVTLGTPAHWTGTAATTPGTSAGTPGPDVSGGTGSGTTTAATNPGESTTVQTTTTAEPVELTKREGVYTFLVVGLDQSKSLSDVIILVTFDTSANTLNCLSIPRDTYSVANDRSAGLKHINLAYLNGGMDQLKTELFYMTGYQVDRHVIVDMNAFVKIINYIGGVNFYVPQDMDYDDPTQDLHIHLKKGYQTLSGADALKLMRFRGYASADIGRISVRHDFLKTLASQLLSSVSRAVEIAGTVYDNVRTDMSLDDLVWFAKEAIGLSSGTISFHTLPGGPAHDSGMWIPYPAATLELINTYMNPYNHDLVYLEMVSRAENAGK